MFPGTASASCFSCEFKISFRLGACETFPRCFLAGSELGIPCSICALNDVIHLLLILDWLRV